MEFDGLHSYQPERPCISLPWGDVTNPQLHNPSKFRYLIHAINPMAKTSMSLVGAMTMKDDPGAINIEEGDQSVNLFSQPERLADRVSMSCSLIDQEHLGSWGKAGLIVEAPKENVVITSAYDAGTIVASKKRLLEQAKRNTLYTAEQLLKQTGSTSYNEVVVIANQDGSKVKLAGFFYKVTEEGSPLDESLYSRMRMHAQRLNLPLVPIEEPNPYRTDKIIANNERYSVQYGGKLYNLQGVSPEWRFKSYSQGGYTSFASPDEVEQVFNFLKQNRVDDQQIEQFRREYVEADTQRLAPKINLDEQGNFSSIEKRSGYGKDESRIIITKSGYARKENVLEEAKKFQEAMSDPSRPHYSRGFEENVLFPGEADQLVEEAIREASQEQGQNLSKWWREAKGLVIKRWEQNQQSRGFNSRGGSFADLFSSFKRQR